VVFSTSHGALASTPTRSTPAFLIASMRGLAPGAGTATSALAVTAAASAASAMPQRNRVFIEAPPDRPIFFAAANRRRARRRAVKSPARGGEVFSVAERRDRNAPDRAAGRAHRWCNRPDRC